MQITGQAALVTGAGSGLGAQVAQSLMRAGARVALLDVNLAAAQAVAARGDGLAVSCDVTDADSVTQALASAQASHGPARIVVQCAGIGTARRVVGRDGPMPLEAFERVVRVNLLGSFNVLRLAAAQMCPLEPLADDERGVIINTASIAAFDGQIGQAAYAASKGGIVAMTLPIARELAQFGVRVLTLAPGLFLTPLLAELPDDSQQALASAIPFPRRLGKPQEFADLALHCVQNTMLNGEVIRIDGALRMAPR